MPSSLRAVVVASVEEHGKTIKEKETALDKWKIMEREQLDAIDEEAKQMEKLANKRSLLLKKVSLPSGGYIFVYMSYESHLGYLQKEESMRKIRELGSLPADAFDKYQSLALSQVNILLNIY